MNGYSEYRKDKRTKNITLRDIHVVDWVQVWSELTERYSPPLKITQICDDGTIYLIIDEENRLDPWEENIKDIDALYIDEDLLKGFGFRKQFDNLYKYEDENIYYDIYKHIVSYDGCFKGFQSISFHEMQDWLYRRDYNIKFNWKGIEK